MTINEIISKYYGTFRQMLPCQNQTIYDGNTSEDMLHNIIITAINKYGNRQVEEEAGYEYLKKTLLMEIKFSKKRKNSKIIPIEGYEESMYYEPEIDI